MTTSDYISVAELAMLLGVFVAPVYALALVLLHRSLRHRGVTQHGRTPRTVALLATTCILAIAFTLAIGVVFRPLLHSIASVVLGRQQLEFVVYLTVPALVASMLALSAGALLSRVLFRAPAA